MRWIGLVVVVLVAIAAVAVLALGRSPRDPVSAAISKSEDAGGFQAGHDDHSVDDGHSGQPVTVTANGVFDQSNADITIDASSALAAARRPDAGGPIEVRYLQENGDPVVYANAPALSTFIPGGMSWVEPRHHTGRPEPRRSTPRTTASGAAATQNPAQALDLLRSIGSVETVGTETVDGASTTHYRATIDLTKACAANLGTDEQGLLNHLIANGAPTSIPVDVWIGDDEARPQADLQCERRQRKARCADSRDQRLRHAGRGDRAAGRRPTVDATGLVGLIGSLPSGSATIPGTTH